MKKTRWLMLHSERGELVRANIEETLPDGRTISRDVDYRLKELPESVSVALRAGRDALMARTSEPLGTSRQRNRLR